MTVLADGRIDLVLWKIERMLRWRETWRPDDHDEYAELVAEETSLLSRLN